MSLHEWPVGGFRLVPPPEMCMGKGCKERAVGMFSWNDKMGRLEDWAGCTRCARLKKIALDKDGVKYRTGAYLPDTGGEVSDGH